MPSKDLELTVTITGLDKTLKLLDPKIAKKAMRSATNKVAKQAFTRASKVIRSRYAIKAGQMNRFAKFYPMRTTGRAAAVLTIKHRTIPLIDLRAKQYKRGVKVKILKKRWTMKEGAFVQTGIKSGRPNVFKRIGKKRYPIKKVRGIALAGLYRSKAIHRVINRYVNKHAGRILKERYDFYLSRVR